MKARSPKIVVAMSGGVDSSVVAALLMEQGYECIGMHLKFWSDPSALFEESTHLPQNKCCSGESLEDARKIAHSLDMPFYVMNTVEPFKEKVVDYFLGSYRKGETPNPCVECNRNIKFGVLLNRAIALGADFLATGHYIRKKEITNGHSPESELWMANDKAKDQSYFLYHLNQEKLGRVMFPLGEYTKQDVYALAEKFGLKQVQSKKESQGVCFFPEKTPEGFLKRHLESQFVQPGPIETVSGQVVGQHEGLPFYTTGQRKAIGIGGRRGDDGKSAPWFVIKIDQARNTLVVGRREDIFRETARVRNLSFVSGCFPQRQVQIEARIRYRFPPVSASLEISKNNEGTVTFTSPVIGISPGQSMVFYEGEKLLGGGQIMI